MTKTLTEQWREGTLPAGNYYCKLYYNGFEPRIQECVKSAYSPKSCIPMSCGCEGEEVLSPVPDYYDCKRLMYDSIELDKARKKIDELVQKMHILEKRLEIATKALKEYANCKPTEWMSCVTADDALKEMEGVK